MIQYLLFETNISVFLFAWPYMSLPWKEKCGRYITTIKNNKGLSKSSFVRISDKAR